MEGQILEPRLCVWNPFWKTGPGFAEAIIAHFYGVSTDEMHAPARGHARTAFARQLAMYLLHVVYGLSLDEVAVKFSRHRSTVAHAIHRVEDMRDDPAVDRLLRRLERLLREVIDMELAS